MNDLLLLAMAWFAMGIMATLVARIRFGPAPHPIYYVSAVLAGGLTVLNLLCLLFESGDGRD